MSNLAWLPLLNLEIRAGTFEQFVLRLNYEKPWSHYLGKLDLDSVSTCSQRLSMGLGLSVKGRMALYMCAASCYNITPTELSLAWAYWRDGTIGELHQRLWHEANMFDHPANHQSYPRFTDYQ